MVGIFNTYHTADHMNPVVGGKQQMLSCLDPLPVQILQGGDAVCSAKFPAKLIFADAKQLLQVIQCISILELLVKQCLHFLNIGGGTQ